MKEERVIDVASELIAKMGEMKLTAIGVSQPQCGYDRSKVLVRR